MKKKNLQIKDFPENAYFKLAMLAEQEGRSLTQQAIAVLCAGLNTWSNPREKRKRIVDKIINRNDRIESDKLKDPVAMIREDRQR